MQRQIAAAHHELLTACLRAHEDATQRPALAKLLDDMQHDGWLALSQHLRQRYALTDTATASPPLDEEDHAIVQCLDAILAQPALLDEWRTDATPIAEALAALVYAATQGEREALEALDELRASADTPTAEATSQALIAMIEGERDLRQLSAHLPAEQAELITQVMHALRVLEA